LVFLALVICYTFRAKCSDVGLCCWLLTIKRDIVGENQAEHQELEMGVKE
jgi:hypothetical protein